VFLNAGLPEPLVPINKVNNCLYITKPYSWLQYLFVHPDHSNFVIVMYCSQAGCVH
jgi:hypothetical protein